MVSRSSASYLQPITSQSESVTLPNTVTWSKIEEEINLLPDFTIENVIQYFVYQKEADGLEKEDWKSLNFGGYKLFREGHVQKIYVSSSGSVSVKAICLPEMKKDRTYSLELVIIPSMEISRGICTCPAGKGPHGSCKHLAALCFAIEDFVKTRTIALEQGEEACTSLLQKWNQPRKRRLDSKKVEEISFSSLSFGKEGPIRIHHKSYDPRPPSMRNTTQLDLDELVEELESLPVSSGFVHLLKKPSALDKSNSALPLIPRSIQARIQHKIMQGSLPPTLATIKSYGVEFIEGITPTAVEKKAIEEKTHLQASSARWHEERHCRLTASSFGQVILRKSGFQKLAETILYTKVPASVPSIKWGRDNESTAFSEYKSQLSVFYPDYKLQKAGFVVGDPAYLGASPDGVLLDGTGSLKGIIEIKCPYSAANITVQEACTMLDDFYCYIDDGNNVRLNSNHRYFYQVQGAMAITDASFCDFIVWTPKSLERVVIEFDRHAWQDMHSKLTDFYIEHMLPLILY